MPRLMLMLGLVTVLMSCTPAGKHAPTSLSPDQRLTIEEGHGPHIVTLENGLSVLILPDDRFPLVNVRLYVHAGSAYETPQITGISHLLEHMVFKGTAKRGPGETAMQVESVGGNLNAATSFDYTVYYVEVPDRDYALGMDIVQDMAFHAKIDPKELDSERKVVLSELDRGQDSPSNRLFKTIQGMIWKGTTYEWPIIGYRDVVEKLSADDIHAYIGRLYQPQSMLLVVAGRVDEDKVLSEARKRFGALRNTRETVPPAPFPVPDQTAPRVQVIPGKWNKVYLGAAFPIPDLRSSKQAGLELLTHLMGGDETSRFYRTFKYDKKLVDDISVTTMSLERSGVLYISATLDADKLAEFWKELMAELASFDPSTFTDQELERARLNLEDSLFLAKETLSGLASKVGYFQFFEGGQQAESNYLFSLRHVDREEMTALYHEFLRPDRLSSCVLVPEGTAVDTAALTGAVQSAWPGSGDEHAATDAAVAKGPSTVDLPGGGKLLLIPDATLPYTALSLYWPGGDRLIAPEQQGLTALAGRSLTRGTATKSATELEDFLSDRAASVGARAGRDTFALNAKFPSRFTDDLLPLIREIVAAPAFDPAEVERAKEDQIAGIRRREDQPLGLAFRHIFPFLFQSAPYSLYHRGTPEVLPSFGPDQLKTYWKQQTSLPFYLAVCGDFDAAKVRAFAASLANDLGTGGQAPATSAPPLWNGEHDKTLHLPGRNQAHLLAVFPIPGKLDLNDTAGLELLRAALAGQSGLLFRDLRDKQGLGYTVTAMNWQAPSTGFMAFYIGTVPEKVDQARDGFERTVKMLHGDLLPEKEIDRARNILLGDYSKERQTLLSRSREAAASTALGLDRSYDWEVVERAQKMTAQDLRELARKYLNWDQAYFLRVLP